MKNMLFTYSFMGLLFILLTSVSLNIQNKPWPVPEKYEKLKNPIQADKSSITIGKAIYKKHCQSCHGKEGLGDGSKAAQLETPSGDFSLDLFQRQSDGSIFYKTKFGRDDMPTFEKKIPDSEDIWHVVNFLRTLGE